MNEDNLIHHNFQRPRKYSFCFNESIDNIQKLNEYFSENQNVVIPNSILLVNKKKGSKTVHIFYCTLCEEKSTDLIIKSLLSFLISDLSFFYQKILHSDIFMPCSIDNKGSKWDEMKRWSASGSLLKTNRIFWLNENGLIERIIELKDKDSMRTIVELLENRQAFYPSSGKKIKSLIHSTTKYICENRIILLSSSNGFDSQIAKLILEKKSNKKSDIPSFVSRADENRILYPPSTVGYGIRRKNINPSNDCNGNRVDMNLYKKNSDHDRFDGYKYNGKDDDFYYFADDDYDSI